MTKKQYIGIAAIIRKHYDYAKKEYEETRSAISESEMILLGDITADLSEYFKRQSVKFNEKKFKNAAVDWDN